MKKFTFLIPLVILATVMSCHQKPVNCDCNIPNNCFHQKTVSFDSLPADLTSIICNRNSGKIVTDELIKILRDSVGMSIKREDHQELLLQLEDEIMDFYGGAGIGDEGNLVEGLLIDGIELEGKEFNLNLSSYKLDLVFQGMTYPDSTNSYVCNLTLLIKVTNQETKETFSSTNVVEERMIKTCRLYSFDESKFTPLYLNKNFHQNRVE
ncbi:hypothetical protein [Pontibacter sp. G13]|uniref:hypothetical protein n=1 Tax=Pontibacter sp. G13 TaxID=3074898 RepID=UPI00288B96EC|nr:hypothetical protein [Pontibacter sp. G13]WNJ17902.1 hypothetical protein RJD25_23865 [Pontibacter sp. G13]